MNAVASPGWRTWLLLFLLALVYTLANAVKPLLIDDTAYHYFAAQAAAQPLDPYGFKILWYLVPEPAMEVLAPPLLPYWWSLAIRLFGEQPIMWKLWLFPFSLLFVVAVYFLLRRFARGLEALLTLMTVFSPAFFPSLNLMLDIPALALSLGALIVFFRACDRQSLGLGISAGILAGLAMQTKYTGFLAPAAMLLYGLVFRQTRRGLVAGITAASLFAGWEAFLLVRYGQSHFLFHLQDNDPSGKHLLILPILSILGATASFLTLLNLAALRTQPKRTALCAGLIAFGYVLVAGIPDSFNGFWWKLGEYRGRFTIAHAVFGLFGAGVLATSGAVVGRLCRVSRADPRRIMHGWKYRTEMFLVLWLGLEIVGYLALSPFPAVRRVLGLLVVLTLLTGRLAVRTCRSPYRRTLLRKIAIGGIGLGAGFYAIDLRDALAEKDVVQQAAAYIGKVDRGQVWYVGHWGFQYYAEQAGMKPIVAGESMLRKGDVLVLPDEGIDQQKVAMQKQSMELIEMLSVSDFLPLRTVPGFYGGDVPLQHQEGSRVFVWIYRVTADFVPEGKEAVNWK
jgi:hypothetical protein